jgi:hypothetical protein
VFRTSRTVVIDDAAIGNEEAVREPLSAAIGNEEAAAVNGLECLNCRSPSVVASPRLDEQAPSVTQQAPSVLSPTLAAFEVEVDPPLPWAECGPSGWEPSLKDSTGLGLDGAATDGLGTGGATELPTSPCSPLFFPSDEATELPASRRAPHRRPPQLQSLFWSTSDAGHDSAGVPCTIPGPPRPGAWALRTPGMW